MLKYLIFLLPTFAMAEVPQGAPNANFSPEFANQTRADALPETQLKVEVFAGGLQRLWGIAALGNDQFLVTERGGSLRLIGADGAVLRPITGIPEVWDDGQGGLLDVAVSPDFAKDRLIFWTYAKPVGRGAATAAARGTLGLDGQLSGIKEIFEQTDPARNGRHFGSRIVPMPDGTVWITTGDRGAGDRGTLVQDDASTHGKVIRMTYDGGVPVGQDGIIWSKGHRNMQGAALQDSDLWTMEHGPRGGDELNRPERGGNYGWPLVSYGVNYTGSPVGTGRAVMDGIAPPVYYWDPVIAPAGMEFYQGSHAPWRGDLLIGSLNPGGLVRLKFAQGRVIGEERLLPDAGRVRDVALGKDGAVMVITDDGEVLRVTPQ